MNQHRYGMSTLIVAGLFALSGADCPFKQYLMPAPRALPPSPTLAQVVQAVNQNGKQIDRISTNRATISGPGWPTLRAGVAWERPRRLRIRAEHVLTGPEVDLGSNEQVFWFWLRRNQPPGIYFCRHEQFGLGRAKQMIPVEPDWLIEALGPGELDPALPHEGPRPLPGDKLEIRTVRGTMDGPAYKVTVIDAARAWVLEQHIYDPQGNLRASAIAESHYRDPVTGLVMPNSIKLNCPAAQFSMRIDLGNVEINRIAGNPAELWTMPNYPNAPLVDLGDPRLQLGPPPTPGAPPMGPQTPHARRLDQPPR
jgi:hypothetical protein